jgi:predicted ATPase
MSVRLQFEGIRCFPKKQDAIIRPITLLVGENSSGKSTFLALCDVAPSAILALTGETSFNSPPFLLGAYDQIASHHDGESAKSFSMTFVVDEQSSIETKFFSRAGQPTLQSWSLCGKDLSLTVEPLSNSESVNLVWKSSRGQRTFKEEQFAFHWSWLWNEKYLGMSKQASKELGPLASYADLLNLHETVQSIQAAFGRAPYAFAPIRTSPQRTYDPVRVTATPEGSHVPMLLAELSYPRVKKDWTRLESNLGEFGKKSGLFERISVVRKGKKESDPFQIGVQSGGPSFNLVDVGYGVSQVLPILVDTLQRSKVNDVFLLQQPEVHLHPRAQAELGSYFARQARKNGRFVIETHSDYIVDRIRLEVRRKTLRPEDVSLLYFERRTNGAMVHNVELGEDGSITNPPKGYRQFFLNETDKLLDI